MTVKNSLISEAVRAEIDRWSTKYPPDRQRSVLLMALRLVQEQNGGWLSVELMDAVADYLKLPKIQVYEVASFYSMYDCKPVGRHKIQVCNSLPCMLRGSEKIIHHLEKALGIRVGETTSDGQLTLKEVECLASCVNAPVLQIDSKHFHEDMTCEKLDQLLEELRQQEKEHAE